MGKFGENSDGNLSAISFGDFRLDRRTGELRKGTRELKLTPRAATVLACLADRSPQLVTKQELFAQVWKGKPTGDEALTSCIRELRRVLSDNARRPRYIETRHRRGYRLMVLANAQGARVPGPSFGKPSITVLPFHNISLDAGQNRLVEGITEDITTTLSCCSDLAVVAHGSSLGPSDSPLNVREVAQQLGVRYVLSGSVRRSGHRLRVAAHLLDALTGEQVWAERVDSDMRDILIVQDRIARQIVATTAPALRRAEERRVGRLPRNSLQAYELSLHAQAMVRRAEVGAVEGLSQRDHRQALKYAERAVALDPDSPFAYAALALVHASLPEHLYFQPAYASALNEASSAAATLQRLDPASYVASYVAGIVCLRRRQPDQALANLKRAYELNSNDCYVLRWLAWAEFNLNLGAEAYAHCTQALRLSPRDPLRYLTFWGLAYASFVMGRAREGADWARQAVSEGPTHYPSYAILAACLAEAGDLNAARLPIEHLMHHRRDYICSRLEGHNYFGSPELSKRFISALRRAAGPAFAVPHSVQKTSRSSAARRASQRSAARKKRQMALRAGN